MNIHEKYLQHHGIKGMKWGVRRYRNEDGTLTAAGKKRYDYEVRRNNNKGRKNRAEESSLNDPDRWVEDDIRGTKRVVDSARDLTRSLEDLDYNTSQRTKKTKKTDFSKMSDEEMRKKINRELLERQYDQVFNSEQTSKGRQTVRDILSTSNIVLGTVSAGLSIALAIKELKKR